MEITLDFNVNDEEASKYNNLEEFLYCKLHNTLKVGYSLIGWEIKTESRCRYSGVMINKMIVTIETV